LGTAGEEAGATTNDAKNGGSSMDCEFIISCHIHLTAEVTVLQQGNFHKVIKLDMCSVCLNYASCNDLVLLCWYDTSHYFTA
jgi:hypothetical protein